MTVRGNGRQEVFHGAEYYLHFLDQLADALEKDEVILYAYVLMPNHYHLFVETPHGNIQRFMQRLNTAYSMYHRYKRSFPGHCFQGRYGAKLVGGDDYIVRLTRYIHRNPINVTASKNLSLTEKVTELTFYPWSSYRGYVDEHAVESMVNYQYLKLMNRKTEKGRRAAYRKYVEGCIAKTDEDFKASLEVSRYAVGDSEFVGQVESDLKDVREHKCIYGDIEWPVGKSLTVDEIVTAVANEFKVDKNLLLTMNYAARKAKKVSLELACRYSNLSQRRVGEYFGYEGNGSVSKQRQSLTKLLSEDKMLSRVVTRIEKRLVKS